MISKTPRCPYCNGTALLVTGKRVYPREEHQKLWKRNFWVCEDCDSRVGCYKESRDPMGPLANKELRRARMKAHEVFDPLWKDGEMRRGDAYKWLASQLNIEVEDCHIGMFNLEMCKKVEKICSKKEKNYSSMG